MSHLFSAPTAPTNLRPLRPYQQGALETLWASLAAGKKHPMVMAPTGAGKTVLGEHLVARALADGKKIAFTVPRLSLINQTVDRLEAVGLSDLGVVQGLHVRTDPSAPIQICSVQTLARRDRPDVNLVIVDEAHEMHKAIFRWMKDCPDLTFVGLSATPWSRGLGKYYDDLIVVARTEDLINDGFLSPFVAYAPSKPDLSGVKTQMGDFHEGQLGEAMNKAVLVGDIVETWLKRGDGRSTFCFCVDRKHAQHIHERFGEAGVRSEYMDGDTPLFERDEIFERFRSGQTRVICSVGVLTTGVDEDVRCIIHARPTKSEILWMQTIGRGLRVAEGKDHLLVLDHAGNCLRLGIPTQILIELLDDGDEKKASERKERSAPLPKLCEECKAVVPPKATSCPQCGHQFHPWSTVKTKDGELVEWGSGGSSGGATPADMTMFYGELRWIAAVRGYAPGWIAHKFKERFGMWPNHPQVKTAAPREPSLKTKNWIRSRAIAFAKGRAAHG